jgi:translation elongation factor EF-Tu-like GTPase
VCVCVCLCILQVYVSKEDFQDLIAIEVANLLEQYEFYPERYSLSLSLSLSHTHTHTEHTNTH